MIEFPEIFDTHWFTYVILPILIFLARISDVTLGTMRIMFVSRGNKLLAPILGFFEILIWLMAIRQIMQNLSNPLCFIAYAAGFSVGNFIGINLEEKLAYGKIIVRIITRKEASALIQSLRNRGFGVTNIPAKGAKGKVNVIYTIIDRFRLEDVIRTINRLNPKAFYTIEDVRAVKEGIFTGKNRIFRRMMAKPRKVLRKRKIYKRMLMQRKSK